MPLTDGLALKGDMWLEMDVPAKGDLFKQSLA